MARDLRVATAAADSVRGRLCIIWLTMCTCCRRELPRHQPERASVISAPAVGGTACDSGRLERRDRPARLERRQPKATEWMELVLQHPLPRCRVEPQVPALWSRPADDTRLPVSAKQQQLRWTDGHLSPRREHHSLRPVVCRRGHSVDRKHPAEPKLGLLPPVIWQVAETQASDLPPAHSRLSQHHQAAAAAAARACVLRTRSAPGSLPAQPRWPAAELAVSRPARPPSARTP